MFFIYPTLHTTCKKAYLENAHHAHYKSCWKSIHHEVDYEITVETTVLEKIVVEMERNIVTIIATKQFCFVYISEINLS